MLSQIRKIVPVITSTFKSIFRLRLPHRQLVFSLLGICICLSEVAIYVHPTAFEEKTPSTPSKVAVNSHKSATKKSTKVATPATTPAASTPVTQTPVTTTKPATAPISSPAPAVVPSPSSSVSNLSPTTGSGSSSSSGSQTSGSSSPPSPIGYTSTNWSGYLSARSGYDYSSVSASWVADSPSGNGSSTSGDATWVGIGGVTSADLIQVGTTNQVSAGGQVTTFAFYEMLPAAAVTISSLSVAPGNSISASIVEVSTNSWIIDISNNTTGKSYENTFSYTSSNSSAEWIEEDPSYTNGHLVPFDSFGSVSFDSALTTVDGTSYNLTQTSAQAITLVNGSGQTIAEPSAISGSGSGFTITDYD